MKKLLMILAALPAATFAIEASAQTNVNAGGTVGIQNRIANLQARLDAGIQAGVIDRNEAANLRRQMYNLQQLEMRYSQNGLSRQERMTLQAQIRTVRDQLRVAGGTGWANRYGWNDSDFDAYGAMYNNGYASGYANGYGNVGYTYDRYGNRVPVQTYATDRYGNPVASGYYGQGGPYEPVRSPSSGIGNVLGSVLGSGLGGGGGVLGSILGNGGLRVGDLITSVLGGALGGASNLGYRDRNDVYFRSDGQRVYEIDARTNTVVRIHPMR